MLATKWKNSNGGAKGLLLVLLCTMTASLLMCSMYPYFRKNANQNLLEQKAEYEKESANTRILLDEEFMRYLRSSIYYMNYEVTPDMDAFDYFTQNYDMSRLSDSEQQSIREASLRLMRNMRNQYTVTQSNYGYASCALGAEKSYGSNGDLEAIARGNDDAARNYYAAALVIDYDSRGVPLVRNSWGLDFHEKELTGYLQQASMSRLMEDNGMESSDWYMEYETVLLTEGSGDTYEIEVPAEEVIGENDQLLKLIPLPVVQNTTFIFGVYDNGYSDYSEPWNDYWLMRRAYTRSGYVIGIFAIVSSMIALALLLQNVPALGLRKRKIFCLPSELTAYVGVLGLAVTFDFLTDFGTYTMTAEFLEDLQYMGFGNASQTMATLFCWIFWTCFAFGWYWLTASLLPYITHPIRTLRENMLCIHFCRWLKKLWLRLWHWATDVEVNEKLSRNIWKIVGINGIIVAALCCIWIGGVAGAVIYSILLYILLKKKCAEITGEYEKLLHMTRTIAAGDLTTENNEDMGLFNPIRDELDSIRSGFRKAVHNEVRSRNMKTELITNVSHDLKTPLTAIITYVDLLKKEDLTEEERREYVNTLDRKSQRLKILIEDLFEVSKAASDNITMNFEDVDLVSLIKQVRLENEDRIQESTLDFRFQMPEERCVLSLDPQRTFRVVENLIQNILKYSMPHSRVYIDLRDTGAEVTVSFKNMSAAEMNFSPDEITERFVRGDLSRNTEGSGLGLAIAQSFVERQNGTFEVSIDGDLFKTVICWKR